VCTKIHFFVHIIEPNKKIRGYIMTLYEVRNLTSALLFGDTKLPDNSSFLLLLEQSFQYILNESTPLKLITQSKDFTLMRVLTNGDSPRYLRKPRVPLNDGEELDIDDELCFAVANLVASYLSKRKPDYFKRYAIEVIAQYNMKIMRAEELIDDN
jgi:hypothetical protein